MLLAARHSIARLGFVCAFVLALAMMILPVESWAAQLDTGAPATAESVLDQPCETGDCTDCGPACAHGCCHGSVVAMTAVQTALPAPFAYSIAAAWTEGRLTPLARPSGPDRPPRS